MSILRHLFLCGQHGAFGRVEPPGDPSFTDEHDVEMIEHNRFLLFDNGDDHVLPTSRALEIVVEPEAQTVEPVWEWTESEFHMFDYWAGDANRLPNGNTRVVNVTRGRIVEVTPSGDTVWEMLMKHPVEGLFHQIYKCERIPME